MYADAPASSAMGTATRGPRPSMYCLTVFLCLVEQVQNNALSLRARVWVPSSFP